MNWLDAICTRSPPWAWAAFPHTTRAMAISIRPPSNPWPSFHADRGDEFRHPLSRLAPLEPQGLRARPGGSGDADGDTRQLFGSTPIFMVAGHLCRFLDSAALLQFQRGLHGNHAVLPTPTSTFGRFSRRCGCCSCAVIATCSGSTGGGIKMIRAELMARQAVREFLQAAASGCGKSDEDRRPGRGQ